MRSSLIAIALLAIACRDRELEQVKIIRDEVCKCRTIECGETAMKKLPASDKPSGRAQSYANEMLSCMARLYLKERPSTDPDAPIEPARGSAEPTARGSAEPTARGSSDRASVKRP